jgi:hypothetical protein
MAMAQPIMTCHSGSGVSTRELARLLVLRSRVQAGLLGADDGCPRVVPRSSRRRQDESIPTSCIAPAARI